MNYFPKNLLVALLFLVPTSLLSSPWDLNAQSEEEISAVFDEAVHHFQMNEFDEALQLLDRVDNPLCGQERYIEHCIHSKIIRANISRSRREFKKAREIIREALKTARHKLSQSHPLLIHVHVEFAYLENYQASYETAKEWADSAIQIVNEYKLSGKPRAQAYLVHGLIEGKLGNYNKEIADYEEVFETVEELERTIEVKKLLTQAHNNIGVAYRRFGEIEKAMTHYQTTLALVRETFGSNHLEMGYAYNSIGTVYFLNGDFGTAVDYFQRSADIFRLNRGENSSPYAAALNNIGSAYYSMNDFENAADIFEKAQRIKENTLGKDHPDTAVGYSNLASIYVENENYDAALENYQRSIAVRKEIYGEDHPNLIKPYIIFGDFYTKTEQYSKAREYFNEALEISKNRLGENHPDSWDILLNVGTTYEEEEEFETALENYKKVYNMIVSESGIQPQNGFDAGLSYPLLFMNAATKVGNIHIKLYERDGGTPHLHQATENYSTSTKVIDFLQYSYQSEASKLNLIDENYSIFTNTIKAYHYLYEETGDESWLDEILATSELSRSRIALELLQDIEAKNFAGVPQKVLDQESTINTQIADFYQQLHAEQEKGFEADQDSISAYRDSLFESRRRLNKLTEQLERNYPDYYRLKYDHNLAGRKDVINLLKADEALINYIVSDDEIFALVLDRENVRFHSLGSSDSLSTQIKSLRNSVLSDRSAQYSNLAYNLYSRLVEPVLTNLDSNSLIIVPDQSLHYLPFEMLLTEAPQHSNNTRFPYLIRDYQISYAPSATVLQMLTEQKISNPQNLFAVAPFNNATIRVEDQVSASRYITDLSPLPLTRYETTEIAKIFEEPQSLMEYIFPEEIKILLGKEATKSMIESTSFEDYGYLHFATHAFVNEEDPALSGIAFWGEQDEGGVIYVNDIYNMNMNVDLVVLGACETGLGTVYKGEGMIGFTRAFIYAGASNLMVSMWKVNDQPTANLMIHFYRYVKDEHSYAEALQMAKMDLINQPEFAAPRNWAAFVLQGR